MQFTKEQLEKELLAKLAGEPGQGEVNLSEKTVSTLVESLLTFNSNDEIELSEFVEKAFPIVKTTDGQLRKQYADFVKSWTEKNPKQNPNPEPSTPNDGEEKTTIQLLKERLETLEREREEEKRINQKQTKLSEIKNLLTSKGVKDDEFINDFLSSVNIDNDTDTIAEKGLRMFNKAKANVSPTQTPSGAVGGKDVMKGWEDVIKARKAQVE